MEIIINGYSVDENLITGAEFYGELGSLIGVVDFAGNYMAIIRDKQGQYNYRDTVIDTSVLMTNKGPNVSERIYMGSTEKMLDDKTMEAINNSLASTGKLEIVGNGEVNIELGLQQSDNSVFVADDEVLKHFKMCKNMHPELPLNFAINVIPYEKTSPKAL